VQIVVNHVTRMTSDDRICVAGVDVETFKHVRPVTPRTDLITRELLRENDGPFGPGAVVDLGEVEACPSSPETEDHRFQTAAASHIGDLSDDEYMALLEKLQDEDIRGAFGPELIEVRPGKLALPAGEGSVSLGVVEPVDACLEVSFGNLYLTLEGLERPAKIRVTDVRFYEPDHKSLRRERIDDVNERIQRGVPIYTMLGLAQALWDGGSRQELHWLMANGICMADRAVSDVP
jgi:hypothetical protein